MARAIWSTVLALYSMDTGRPCRSCGQGISTRDAYGRSEGICSRCRHRSTSIV